MLRQHLLLATLIPASALIALGQSSPSSPSQPPAPIAFEVSSVRISRSGTSSSSSTMNNDRFTSTNTTLKNLMAYTAFNIPESRIVGGPAWLNSTRFDIEAKLDADTYARWNHLSRHEYALAGRAMFQQLFAERFHLRFHWETRTLPIYALTPAKGGPHLHPSTQQDADTDTTDDQITGKGITLDDLARTLTQELSHELGRVIVNQTSIPGRFDLTLTWTPATASPAPGSDSGDLAAGSGPSIFTATEEQLGLKLVPTRGPVQVLVIDQLDLPSSN